MNQCVVLNPRKGTMDHLCMFHFGMFLANAKTDL